VYLQEDDTVKIAKEFKDFIAKGNVVDLAVAVVIGGAFTTIVNSLVDDLIMPLVAIFTSGISFDEWVWNGFKYGSFISALITFLIVAIVVFILVKAFNKITRRSKEEAPATQDCPYCTAKIPAAAVRCPNCTSVLDEEAVPQAVR